MGISANVAKIDPPISHVLDDHFRTVIVPDNVDDETKRHFIDEFQKSIIANGLRELVETYSLYLTEVHAVTVLAHRAQNVPLEEKTGRPFDRDGVGTQLERLHAIFGEEFKLTKMFESLVTARNCMTHNRGVVRQEDCAPGTDHFELTWRKAIGRFKSLADGRALAELEAGTAKGIGTTLGEESVLELGFRDHTVTFPVGGPIEIGRQDLAQICQGVIAATDLVGEALVSHLRKLGVPQTPAEETRTGDPRDV